MMYPTVAYTPPGAGMQIQAPPQGPAPPVPPAIFGPAPSFGHSQSSVNSVTNSMNAMSLQSAGSGNLGPAGMNIHMVVTERYRLDPPVKVPMVLLPNRADGLPNLPPQGSFDFEYENKIMNVESTKNLEGFLSQPSVINPPQLSRLTAMGYPRLAVTFALGMYDSNRDETKIVDFCTNYNKLMGMGFDPTMALGALAKSRSYEEAADMCASAC